MVSFKSNTTVFALSLAVLGQKAYAWGNQSHGSPTCPDYTKLNPRNSEYREHCEAVGTTEADFTWPCFTFWAGSLASAKVYTDSGKDDMDKDVLIVKNGDMYDFTVRDPAKKFTLSWNAGDLMMTYSDYDKSTGCYKITLQHQSTDGYRIWISDENNEERNADTQNYRQTFYTVCTKWTHIHVKNDA